MIMSLKFLKLVLVVCYTTTFFGQGLTSCTATELISDGTYLCPALTTGTYEQICFASVSGIHGKWYKYTPSQNGVMIVNSVLAQNGVGTTSFDTRLTVAKGSCTALECYAANDNYAPTSSYPFLAAAAVPVEAGVTYYIQWDSRWEDRQFYFAFSFTPSDCLPIGQFDDRLPIGSTSTSTELVWQNAIGNPENYVVYWGDGFIENNPANQVVVPADPGQFTQFSLTNLPEGANISYRIAPYCNGDVGFASIILHAFLAKDLPYTFDFEGESPINVFTDGFIGFNLFTTNDLTIPANYADGGQGNTLVTANSPNAVSDKWGYSRALNLVAGQQVTISFKTRLFSFGSVSPMSMRLTVGNSQSSVDQTNQLGVYNLTNTDSYTTHTATFVPSVSGVYYFGFHNNSPASVNQTFTFFDTVTITPSLSTVELNENALEIYPNPVDNNVNISSNIFITGIRVFDVSGKEFMIQKLSESSYDFSTLSTGIYLVQIMDDKDNIVTQKVVKK